MKLQVAALALVTSVFAVCQAVLEHAKRVGVADTITANSEDIAQRVQEGFLALLMQGGPTADDVIRLGRATAGR